MSNYRKQQRKAEIREVRENARKAFYEGKHIQSCPYQYCDRMQWEEEFLRLKYMEEEKQRNSKMEMLADSDFEIEQDCFRILRWLLLVSMRSGRDKNLDKIIDYAQKLKALREAK